MELREARGKLIAIGGGEFKEGDAPLLKEFVKLAHGARARVVVMTAATDDPLAAANEYRAAFRRLGRDGIKVVDVSSRQDAADPGALQAIEQATGLFFTGALNYTSLPDAEEEQSLSRFGLRVHVLSAGHRFNLHRREPVIEEEVVRKAQSSDSDGAEAPGQAKKHARKAAPERAKGKK